MMQKEPRRNPEHLSEREMLLDMYARMIGDGTEDTPGLTLEVDRLKRQMKLLMWGIGTIVATIIAAVTSWLTGMFHGKSQ